MFGFSKREPVVAEVHRPRSPAVVRDFCIGVVAFFFAAAALGFFSAGAYVILSPIYNPAGALFMIGGCYAALSLLMTLYLVLGGHEVARAAHADTNDPAVMDGLGPPAEGPLPAERSVRVSRARSLSVIMLGVFVASWTAVRRLTR